MVAVAAATALIIARHMTSDSATSARASADKQRSHQPSATTPSPQLADKTRTTPVAPGQLADDLGEMIVARYSGTTPSRELLQRIREHEIGGVILFGENTIDGASETQHAIASMQRDARYAHNYPLLIMADQEGGTVKRLPDDPPVLAASDMRSSSGARAEGYATGVALRRIGINLDLAPVADVEQAPDSFLGTRAFGSTASIVEERACAFAAGLAAAGIGYTLKHFPGLGSASASTDIGSVVVNSTKASLRANYAAYRKCGRGPRAVIMISSAGYPALQARTPRPSSAPRFTNESSPPRTLSRQPSATT